jgi:phosphoglycolate phosphatase-like HAD superfamily hydrolase
MVGDGLTDVIAGRSAGCKTILIGSLKCDVCKLMDVMGVKPDYIVPSLNHASEIIEREVKGIG